MLSNRPDTQIVTNGKFAYYCTHGYGITKVCRISILDDLQNYTENCNSVLTQQGFSLSLENNTSNKNKSIIVFILTAAMQVAFLGSKTVKQILGYDFMETEDRAAYIKKIVDILFEGKGQIDE